MSGTLPPVHALDDQTDEETHQRGEGEKGEEENDLSLLPGGMSATNGHRLIDWSTVALLRLSWHHGPPSPLAQGAPQPWMSQESDGPFAADLRGMRPSIDAPTLFRARRTGGSSPVVVQIGLAMVSG